MERELTEACDIADGAGRLRRDAIGWSRHPTHRCNLPAGLARVHAFDYWCVTTRTSALTVLVADVGLAGVALVSFLDLAGGSPIERIYVRPRGLPVPMPASPHGELVLDVRRLQLRVGGDRLEAHARTITGHRLDVELTIERPAGHETVNVLVPWDDERFHFTSKQQALPARGRVVVDGREHRFEPATEAFACRDFGRGRWPSGIDWRWAFASARRGGRTIGLNLGGLWTDGTGVGENALVIDGRVHKIDDAVDFDVATRGQHAPWRIRTRRSGRVDLTFTPVTTRAVTLPPLIKVRQCVGRFAGTVVDDAGVAIVLDDVIGVAETVHGRW